MSLTTVAIIAICWAGLGVFFLIRGHRQRDEQVDDRDQEPMVTA